MAVLRGFISELVLGKESSYGTAPSSGQTVPFKSESLTAQVGSVEVPIIRGSLYKAPDVKGLKKVAGSITGILGYEGYEALLVAALGEVSTTDNGDGTYTHTITPATTLSKSLTAWIDRGPRIFRFSGLKVNALTLKGEAALDGGLVEWEAEFVGKDFDSNSSFPGTVNADKGEPYVMVDQLSVKLGDQEDALGASDVLYPSTFELKIANNLVEDHYAAGSDTVLEPVRGGWLEITLTLGFPRFQDSPDDLTLLRTWAEQKTALQATLTFSYGSDYSLAIKLGNLRVKEGAEPQVGGPEVGGIEITLEGFVNDSVYNNPNLSDALKVELKNKVSSAW